MGNISNGLLTVCDEKLYTFMARDFEVKKLLGESTKMCSVCETLELPIC